ncbi:IS4 family transposase [Dictyobacter aurantiacus]|uniref:Transposase n=1 Tax=Dictyobacter aurantiacus TaxID=1936993 RepID=A0A401ZK08_9CHLR|nr:IS4 family transposase [Dictyobacter aurantiacus]GCE07168.1 transposase [Dictyobacter aurantiacus]
MIASILHSSSVDKNPARDAVPQHDQRASTETLSSQLSFSVLESIYPRTLVARILTQTRRWEQRERKLSQLVMVYVLITWMLLPLLTPRRALGRLVNAARLLGTYDGPALPTAAALVYRRRKLGVMPLRRVFEQVCLPLATPQTPGAFRFGRRLVSIDGTSFNVADTPANARAFGYQGENKQAKKTTTSKPSERLPQSPFPKLRALLLVEDGTHAIIGARFAPVRVSEPALLPGVLSQLTPGMLLTLDAGLRSARTFEQIRAQGADVIGRIASGDFMRPWQVLADGSSLVRLKAKDDGLQQDLLIRIIEYRLQDDIAIPIAQQRRSRSTSGTRAPKQPELYRICTTLLDPREAPAREVAGSYHERWEEEVVIDEGKTHQLVVPMLGSKSPLLVIQQAYALLLGHDLLRVWMHRSAQQEAGLDTDRLSFTETIEVVNVALTLGTVLDLPQATGWQERLREMVRQRDLRLSERRVRSYPRVVKQSHNRFERKRETDVGFRAPQAQASWEQYLMIMAKVTDLVDSYTTIETDPILLI